MPYIQVCSLARLADTVAAIDASHVLTLINDRTPVTRPTSILEDRHLYIPMSDILEPLDGHILPAEAHVRSVIAFAMRWDRAKPMVVHCYAGVSRSTAAALISACALNPERSEAGSGVTDPPAFADSDAQSQARGGRRRYSGPGRQAL